MFTKDDMYSDVLEEKVENLEVALSITEGGDVSLDDLLNGSLASEVLLVQLAHKCKHCN